MPCTNLALRPQIVSREWKSKSNQEEEISGEDSEVILQAMLNKGEELTDRS